MLMQQYEQYMYSGLLNTGSSNPNPNLKKKRDETAKIKRANVTASGAAVRCESKEEPSDRSGLQRASSPSSSIMGSEVKNFIEQWIFGGNRKERPTIRNCMLWA